MSARSISCPQCGEELTLDAEMSAKPKVRCPDCKTVFPTPRKRKSRGEKPLRRRSRPRRSSRDPGVSVGLIVAGIVVLLALVVGGLFASGLFRGKGAGGGGGDGPLPGGSGLFPQSDPGSKQLITKDNFAKLEHGMTLEEIQAILGTGKASSEDDMKLAFGNQVPSGPNGTPEEKWINNGQGAGVTAWYQWRADDFSIFVGFGKGKRTGKLKALLRFWVERVAAGQGLYGFYTGAGFLIQSFDPDQITDARDAQNRLINDPKWKKGKERELLLGRWQDNLRFGYEFGADGTVKVTGIHTYSSVYRFVDDDHIEFNVPAAQAQPARIEKLRVLVTKDELLLVRDLGQRRDLLEYKRIK